MCSSQKHLATRHSFRTIKSKWLHAWKWLSFYTDNVLTFLDQFLQFGRQNHRNDGLAGNKDEECVQNKPYVCNESNLKQSYRDLKASTTKLAIDFQSTWTISSYGHRIYQALPLVWKKFDRQYKWYKSIICFQHCDNHQTHWHGTWQVFQNKDIISYCDMMLPLQNKPLQGVYSE